MAKNFMVEPEMDAIGRVCPSIYPALLCKEG